MFKQITIICLMMPLFSNCIRQSKEKAFLAKYEFENFSQFNGVDMILRGVDKHGNFIILGSTSQLLEDSSIVISYAIILDKENYQTMKTELGQAEYYVDTDTVKLQQLAQVFMQYEIPRLDVDTAGNIFIYLKDFETLSMVRFANESELQKRSKETKWKNIKKQLVQAKIIKHNSSSKPDYKPSIKT